MGSPPVNFTESTPYPSTTSRKRTTSSAVISSSLGSIGPRVA